jgi:hypothetical protein
VDPVAGFVDLVVGWRGLVVGWADLVVGWRGLVVGWADLVVGWRGLVVGCADLLAGPPDLAAGPDLAGVLLAALRDFGLAGVALTASASSSLVSTRTLPVESNDRFGGRLAGALPARCLAAAVPLAVGRL